MAKKKRDQKPGHGKLLDAWVAPDAAGGPVGCLATSFTFSPVFYEEECLARFLQLESDPTEDGPIYLVEREEKLAQVTCAAALVDQHHCKGSRSLRWDLLAGRLPHGLQHAKICVLLWSRLLRIIISSANLTDDGYRRNQEVFGVLDYLSGGEAPLTCLNDTLNFLRQAATYSAISPEARSPAVTRWNSLLDRATEQAATWGLTDDELRRSGVRVQTVFSGPGYPTVFESLSQLWPGYSPPDDAYVLSPFFDRPEVVNAPAKQLWGVLRQRGEANVHFHVAAEDVPGEDAVFLHAPKSLLDAQPQGRWSVGTSFHRVMLEASRPLHAKGIWLENDRWSIYQIGSSNFTSAGTGLSKNSNLEANLVYIVDAQRNAQARRLLNKTFPASERVDLEGDVQWKPIPPDGEDALSQETRLNSAFGDAVYHCNDKGAATVTLSFIDAPPVDWELLTDGDDQHFFGEHAWAELGKPTSCELPWTSDRPPSGFWVQWKGSVGRAWWPVNVTAGDVLPPPEELKNLPLEVLINILSSARPLHRVLKDYLRRKQREKGSADDTPIIDPHKRVDTSQFLLQRTRRISWALNALRERLERPVVTVEFLKWRLHGPVGVMALAKALVREAKSDEEKAFLISELALELARAKPEPATGCLPPEQHVEEIRTVIAELRALVPENTADQPDNLRQYVNSVFDTLAS